MRSDISQPSSSPRDAVAVLASQPDASGQLHRGVRPIIIRTRELSKPVKIVGQVAILVVILAAWQFLPMIPGIATVFPFLDPFFISSPLRVAEQLGALLAGEDDFYKHLAFTASGAGIGFVIAFVVAFGLAIGMGESRRLSAVLMLPLDVINVVPTIVFIPVIIILFGASLTTSILTVFLAVFFFVFFNAYAGAVSVPADMIQSDRLLGARKASLLLQVRARYASVWTIETLPGALGRALVAAFSAELLSGSDGLGRLVLDSLLTLDAALTFSVVIVLSVFGASLVGLTNAAAKRYLHWWSS